MSIVKRSVRTLALACLPALQACAPAAVANSPAPVGTAPVFPLASWETIPAAQLDAACRRDLDATRAYLGTLSSTAMLAVQDGRALFSYGPTDASGNVFSVRKSILAMLYGNEVAQGRIDLTRTLSELGLDDVGGLLARERGAQLEHLLSARSGVYHRAANGGDDAAAAPARGSQAPGSYFLYNNWDFNAAGSAFEQLSGRSVYRAFAEDLATPLQLEDFNPGRQRLGGDATRSRHLAYHFSLSTRDMARLGYLMLRQGNWRGRQLIPAPWLATITAPHTKAAEMHPPHTARRGLDYGYLWWVMDEPPASPLHGAYLAWGVYGQYILVIPQRNMVLAHRRDVAPGAAAGLRWVQLDEFLRAARMLAGAPCPHGGE